MSETTQNPGFNSLGIPPNLLQKIDRLGFSVPTPIQAQAIPVALQRRDVIGIAQTGTGKTLAFAIPMMANLRHIQVGLVLAPTRELALQIDETYRKLGIKSACIIGGAPMSRQISALHGRPSIIVATPGRLLDHMNQRTVSLQMVGVVVLDEADRMLDMGFAPAIKTILDATPKDRQTMLFSATMPKEIADLAQRYLKNPTRIEIARSGTAAEQVEQSLYVVEKEMKPSLLGDVLRDHRGSVLVFTRTRHGARKLARTVRGHGYSAAELHSDRTLAQRTAALAGFKSGEYRVLVATDIAARGIDVKEIGLVINYDVPENPEDYVHRIGRTGRAGATGVAITFATPDQHRDVRDIEKLTRTELPLSPDSRLKLQPARPAGRTSGPQRTPGNSLGARQRNKRYPAFGNARRSA
jgi:ATP-dependent RNA helicase RhlE